MTKLKSVFDYFDHRLKEKSTWASIGVGIPVASALPHPWGYFALVCTVIGVLTPTT